jgi:hypothetical protein
MTVTPNSTDIYTIDEAAELLADYDKRKNDTFGSAKDRTKKLINYHIKRGHLKVATRGRIELGVLIDWARQQKSFDENLNEYPIKYIHISSGGVKFGGESDIRFVKAPPDSLDSCHNLIGALEDEISKKDTEIKKLKIELNESKVKADKWDALALKNKKNATKSKKL